MASAWWQISMLWKKNRKKNYEEVRREVPTPPLAPSFTSSSCKSISIFMHLVMENRGETIEIPKKFTECTQHIRVPMKTTVWACSEPLQAAPRCGVTEFWDQPLTVEPKQVWKVLIVTLSETRFKNWRISLVRLTSKLKWICDLLLFLYSRVQEQLCRL